MGMPLSRLAALAEADRLIDEGDQLLREAEERLRQINQATASEGCRLTAAQILKAMGRTGPSS